MLKINRIEGQNGFVIFIIICILIFLISSCSKEFINPYDPATRKDEWMPRDFRLDTLGINSLHLHWQQDNRHIDGYVVQKYTNGALKEYLVFRDTIDFIDSNAVEATTEATCPEIRYEVLARAGRNRSDAVGMQSPIYMPLSVPAYAGEDAVITGFEPRLQLNAQVAANGEIGTWSVVSGEGGSFSDVNSAQAVFSGRPCSSYALRWSLQGCSNSSDELNVTFNQQSNTANAGPDVSVAGTTQLVLNANAPASGETGAWTILSGNGGLLIEATQFNSSFSGLADNQYLLRWSLTGACNASADYVLVKFE